jgi:hypothetical protein
LPDRGAALTDNAFKSVDPQVIIEMQYTSSIAVV